MTLLPRSLKVHLALGYTDMRKGIDGLTMLVQAVLRQDPFSGQIDQMLTEARVILPGSQALLGFQLAIVLTQAFDRLPSTVKVVHGAALLFVALSIVLLMAPAAYHRIVFKGEDSEEFLRIGGLSAIRRSRSRLDWPPTCSSSGRKSCRRSLLQHRASWPRSAASSRRPPGCSGYRF
jgi:hypothetical protein